MVMANGGLAKLVEECGELIQVAGKHIAFPTGEHPDGAGSLKQRLEEEIADVFAACSFVILANDLDATAIMDRETVKLKRFIKWWDDDEARRARWAHAPESAMYLAQDADSACRFYTSKPVLDSGGNWYGDACEFGDVSDNVLGAVCCESRPESVRGGDETC